MTRTEKIIPFLRPVVYSISLLFYLCFEISCTPKTPKEVITGPISADTLASPSFPDQNQIYTDIEKVLSEIPACSQFYDMFRNNALSSLFSVGKDWNYAVLTPTNEAFNAMSENDKLKFISHTSARINKITLVNNHIATMTRNYPWTGGPTIGNINVALIGKEFSFEKINGNVLEVKSTPLGNQILIIDKVIIKT